MSYNRFSAKNLRSLHYWPVVDIYAVHVYSAACHNPLATLSRFMWRTSLLGGISMSISGFPDAALYDARRKQNFGPNPGSCCRQTGWMSRTNTQTIGLLNGRAASLGPHQPDPGHANVNISLTAPLLLLLCVCVLSCAIIIYARRRSRSCLYAVKTPLTDWVPGWLDAG